MWISLAHKSEISGLAVGQIILPEIVIFFGKVWNISIYSEVKKYLIFPHRLIKVIEGKIHLNIAQPTHDGIIGKLSMIYLKDLALSLMQS